MVESERIASARAGHRDAFAALVETYHWSVFNLCYRMLGDAGEAEDAAQETFLRAYCQIHRYDPERPFKTWLFAIASHHCIDRLRKRRWHWLSLDDALSSDGALWRSPTPGPEESALRHERRDEVTAAISRTSGGRSATWRRTASRPPSPGRPTYNSTSTAWPDATAPQPSAARA